MSTNTSTKNSLTPWERLVEMNDQQPPQEIDNLCKAVVNAELPQVLQAIARLKRTEGADINASGIAGTNGQGTPLVFAADMGNIEKYDALRKAGARLDAVTRMGMLPLQRAIYKGHLPMVEHILEDASIADAINKPDDRGLTPLMEAIIVGHNELLAPIEEKGGSFTREQFDALAKADRLQASEYVSLARYIAAKHLAARGDAMLSSPTLEDLQQACLAGDKDTVDLILLANEGGKLFSLNTAGTGPDGKEYDGMLEFANRLSTHAAKKPISEAIAAAGGVTARAASAGVELA